MAGPCTGRFALERHDLDGGHCVCDVLSPTRASYLRLGWRSAWAGLATAIHSSAVKLAIYRRLGVRIGRGVYLSPGAFLDPFYPHLIELADDSFLGLRCCLLTHEYTATHFRLGGVVVGQGSVIGAFATVRCGVRIGRRATVGAHSFVSEDVADGETVGGVPARSLRH